MSDTSCIRHLFVSYKLKKMKKLLYILIVIITVVGINACTDTPSQANLETQILSLEDSVFTNNMEVKPAQEDNVVILSKKYQEYASTEGTPDSSAVDALFKAVALAKNVNRSYAKAIQLLNKIYTDYPESPRASTALFYEGFTYANDLQDFDKAKKVYDEFLKKYPTDPMAASVMAEIENLGKTPDQIIEEFQKKAAEEEK